MWWIYRCAVCINTKRCATEFEHIIVNTWLGKSLGRSIPSMTPRARQFYYVKQLARACAHLRSASVFRGIRLNDHAR